MREGQQKKQRQTLSGERERVREGEKRRKKTVGTIKSRTLFCVTNKYLLWEHHKQIRSLIFHSNIKSFSHSPLFGKFGRLSIRFVGSFFIATRIGTYHISCVDGRDSLTTVRCYMVDVLRIFALSFTAIRFRSGRVLYIEWYTTLFLSHILAHTHTFTITLTAWQQSDQRASLVHSLGANTVAPFKRYLHDFFYLCLLFRCVYPGNVIKAVVVFFSDANAWKWSKSCVVMIQSLHYSFWIVIQYQKALKYSFS